MELRALVRPAVLEVSEEYRDTSKHKKGNRHAAGVLASELLREVYKCYTDRRVNHHGLKDVQPIMPDEPEYFLSHQ